MKRLLLIGGGHAHVEVLRRFARAPLEQLELVLVSPKRCTAYSGMLPGLIAGHYLRRETHIDVERLGHAARARVVQDNVVAIKLQQRIALCRDGAEISYDYASLDIGSVPNLDPIAQSQRIGLPVRPVERLLAGVETLIEDVRRRRLDIAVVGGGAGGIELAFALDYRLRRVTGAHRARFAVITISHEVLPGYAVAVRRHAMRALEQRGITLYTDSRVVGVADDSVTLESGERIAADRVIWVTGPAPAPWVRGSGLATDPDGFVLVNDHLQSVSHAELFAAGDVATMLNYSRPKSGVYAVRQGPPLAANLRRALLRAPLRAFQPQRRALQLITTGERHAIAAWDEVAFAGNWVWRWKDWIDRRFVARYAR